MFERLLGLSDAEFKRGETGRLLNRFTIDAGNVTSSATSVITVVVRETLVVVALLCVLLYMSWQLTLIVLVMHLLSILLSRFFLRRLRFLILDLLTLTGEFTHLVGQAITGPP